MADSLWQETLKSLLDKVLIGALIWAGGYLWTHWIQADITFWENETKRLQTESEMLTKLVPPGQSIEQDSLHGSALLAMGTNGQREAVLRLCNVAGKDYATWCSPGQESTGLSPDAGVYLKHRVIAPGRLAFYDAIVEATRRGVQEASPAAQHTVAQTVDESFRHDPVRREVADRLAAGGDPTQAIQAATAVGSGGASAQSASVQRLARALPMRVYMQVDVAAPAEKYNQVRQALVAQHVSEDDPRAAYIVPSVERVPSEKVPTKTQIRYFADEDKARAAHLQAWLKTITPSVDAALV